MACPNSRDPIPCAANLGELGTSGITPLPYVCGVFGVPPGDSRYSLFCFSLGIFDLCYPPGAPSSPPPGGWSMGNFSDYLEWAGIDDRYQVWTQPTTSYTATCAPLIHFSHGAFAAWVPNPQYWHCGGITGAYPNQRPYEDGGSYYCHCCPDGFTYDPDSGRCLQNPCPPGLCWCEAGCRCVPCPRQPCHDERHCAWNTTRCIWECEAHPDCAYNEQFNLDTCGCEPCPPGRCWCENRGYCVPCEEPPCKEALNCRWDTALCQWVCDPPNCPPGQQFDDCTTCTCLPQCEPGTCWCVGDPYGGYFSGTCVPCVAPDCADELHCCWDPLTCAWDCESPAELCGEGRTFDPATCRCKGGPGGPANLQDERGRYHVATESLKGIRYRRSETTTPPFRIDVQATELPSDSDPALAMDWRLRVLLLFRRGTGTPDAPKGVYESFSDDEGATWSTPELVAEDAQLPVVRFDPRNGLTLRAWYAGGKLVGTHQESGAAAPGAVYTHQEWDPDAEALIDLELEAAGFDIQPEAGGPGQWLLIATPAGGTDEAHWFSGDDGLTWTRITGETEEEA